MVADGLWKSTLRLCSVQVALVLLALGIGKALPNTGELMLRSNHTGRMSAYGMDVRRGLIYPMIQPTPTYRDFATTPDGAWVAFVGVENRNRDIFLMRVGGDQPRNVTHRAGDDLAPSWSPDGKHLAFSSNRSGDRDIYVMDVDTATVLIDSAQGDYARDLTNFPGGDDTPVWSPDSRWIAFISDRRGNWDIFVIHPDGSGLRQLTDNEDVDRAPVWSPDSQQIAFTSHRGGNWDIYAMTVPDQRSAPESNLHRLTFDPGWDGDFAWAP
jgi:dipeptidyl aminopeptidase/acylaminoacyl peptidase